MALRNEDYIAYEHDADTALLSCPGHKEHPDSNAYNRGSDL